MIDHVVLPVRDYAASKAFYERALQPLDYAVVLEFENVCGFGARGKPSFWIRGTGEAGASVHVAFTSSERRAVDAFYEAALGAGGGDNGPPGIRALYHEHYYGAYVHDPDGNNVEAVCHTPE